MQKILLYIGALALLLTSCHQPSVVSVSPNEITLLPSEDILPISSFAESVDYVELKLDQVGISLGEVEAVKQINDDWIVQHRMSGRSSFIRLNRKGDFITELANSKMKQIVAPSDILDYEDGYAILAENGVHLVSKEGKYIRKLASISQLPGSKFLVRDGHFYVLNEKFEDQLLVEISESSRGKNKADQLLSQVQRTMYTNTQNYAKTTTYFSVLSDSIYRFSAKQNGAFTKLVADGIPTFAELVRKMKGMEEKEALKYMRETNHVMVRKYLENSRFIYLTYWFGSKSSTLVMDKASGILHYFGHGVNDIDGGIWERPLFLTSRNELVIPLTAGRISGHTITNKKERNFQRLQDKIAASGNPVLMLCKLK